MPSAFDVLARDHEEFKRTLAELELGPTYARGANSDQLMLRKKLVEQLVIEMAKHEAVEELYFWPAVRNCLPDGNDLANRGQEQEQEGKVILDQLGQLAPEDAEFEGRLSMFIASGLTHLAFEELAVWPELQVAMTLAEAEDLGDKIEQGKESAYWDE